MATEDVQTNLRLPADLKERLTASAVENGRSLSAEVAIRLRNSYDSLTSSSLAYGDKFAANATAETGHILVGASAPDMRARFLAAEGQAIAQEAAIVGLRQQILSMESRLAAPDLGDRAQLEDDIASLRISIRKIEANSKALRTLAESFRKKAESLESAATSESRQIGIPNFLRKNAEPKP